MGSESEAESSTQGELGPSARQCPCSSAHSDIEALPGISRYTDQLSHMTSISAFFIFPTVNANFQAQTFQDVEDIEKKDDH